MILVTYLSSLVRVWLEFRLLTKPGFAVCKFLLMVLLFQLLLFGRSRVLFLNAIFDGFLNYPMILNFFIEFLGWILFLHLNPKKNFRRTDHWFKSLHHVILVSCFNIFYCLYQLPKYGLSGFFRICGPYQLIGWLIQTSQSLSYSPHSMEVKKAKQTYFIQERLPQLLLRSAVCIIFHSLATSVV